jgi:hypothetical protein
MAMTPLSRAASMTLWRMRLFLQLNSSLDDLAPKIVSVEVYKWAAGMLLYRSRNREQENFANRLDGTLRTACEKLL